jgi:hypothetical protein
MEMASGSRSLTTRIARGWLAVAAVLLISGCNRAGTQTTSPDESVRPIFNALQIEKDREAIGRRYGKTAAELDAIEKQGRAAGWTVSTEAGQPDNPGEEIVALQRDGLLKRLDPKTHTAHVDPVLWGKADADAKARVISLLSKHVALRTGAGDIKLYDARNGRLVAEFSMYTGVALH